MAAVGSVSSVALKKADPSALLRDDNKGALPDDNKGALPDDNKGAVSYTHLDVYKRQVWDNLTILHQRLKAKIAAAAEHDTDEHGTGEYQLDRSPSPQVETAVPAARLRALGEDLLRVPDGFTVHPKLVKQLERRRELLVSSDPHATGIDWAHAEALAFASLLTEGTPLRLSLIHI